MTTDEAKRVLQKYKNMDDSWSILIDSLSEDVSEAVTVLCSENSEYVLAGYIKGSNFYHIYKSDKVSYHFTESMISYYNTLCTYCGGLFYSRKVKVSSKAKNVSLSISLDEYDSNVNNCKDVLDRILLTNYLDKYKNKVDFLLGVKFGRDYIKFVVIE